MVGNRTVAFDQEIRWTNPDPPHEEFRFPYYVRSGPEAWDELLGMLRKMDADRFVVVCDGGLPADIAESVRARLSSIGPCSVLRFDRGEGAKDLRTVYELGNAALRTGAMRSSVIIGLGGGLAGNVAGLLAGLFLRGARLVHVPTTLLAMSDSCLSLKQGVNSELGKNHFGMFYAPAFVWTDLSFLRSCRRGRSSRRCASWSRTSSPSALSCSTTSRGPCARTVVTPRSSSLSSSGSASTPSRR